MIETNVKILTRKIVSNGRSEVFACGEACKNKFLVATQNELVVFNLARGFQQLCSLPTQQMVYTICCLSEKNCGCNYVSFNCKNGFEIHLLKDSLIKSGKTQVKKMNIRALGKKIYQDSREFLDNTSAVITVIKEYGNHLFVSWSSFGDNGFVFKFDKRNWKLLSSRKVWYSVLWGLGVQGQVVAVGAENCWGGKPIDVLDYNTLQNKRRIKHHGNIEEIHSFLREWIFVKGNDPEIFIYKVTDPKTLPIKIDFPNFAIQTSFLGIDEKWFSPHFKFHQSLRSSLKARLVDVVIILQN